MHTLKLLENFLKEVDRTIPGIVKVQFYNGREVHIRYIKAARSFCNLDPLYHELGGDRRFILMMSYAGEGIFSVDIIDKNCTEIEYPTNKRIPKGPVTCQGNNFIWIREILLFNPYSIFKSCIPYTTTQNSLVEKGGSSWPMLLVVFSKTV